ncbi:MAG: hypothetical protein OXI87_06605 [Albidovulum sp.]|nr:hypothetical protein [Albidovulum sp.]
MLAHTYSPRYDIEFPFGDVSTVFFPRILLEIIIVLSRALAFKGARGKSGDGIIRVNASRVILALGVAALGIAGVWYLGFLVALPIAIFLPGDALGYPNKRVLVLTSFVAPLIVWGVLAKFALGAFPTGTIF